MLTSRKVGMTRVAVLELQGANRELPKARKPMARTLVGRVISAAFDNAKA